MPTGSKTGSQKFLKRAECRKAREEWSTKEWLWGRKTKVMQLFPWVVEKTPLAEQKGTVPNFWCSMTTQFWIFVALQEGVANMQGTDLCRALTFMWLLQIFIYCVILNLLHRSWLHAPRLHKAASLELPKKRRRCRHPGKSGSVLAPTVTPRANIFVQSRYGWCRGSLCFAPCC